MAVLVALLFVYNFFDSEVTVYNMFCTKGRVNGACASIEETANPTTYKVLVDQQSVVYWIDHGAPVRFPYCAVRNVQNWSCKYETGNEIPEREYTMTDGYFSETEKDGTIGGSIFYQVSGWHWWSIWLAQKLR